MHLNCQRHYPRGKCYMLKFQITLISLTLHRFSCGDSFIDKDTVSCLLLADVQEVVLHLSAEL